MDKISFGIVGAGWRTEFFLRIAKELPERFEVSGILVRNQEKGKAIENRWNVKTYTDMDEFLKKGGGSFVVVAVPWSVCPVMVRELAGRGAAVLSETPPAPDLEGLLELNRSVGTDARVQVAEQYQFQPAHAARISAAESGILGTVTQVQMSVAHGYHGVSLMRRLLGVGFENAEIIGRHFNSPIVAGPGRSGPPAEERIVNSGQDIAILSFKGKLGIFDFTGDQYFSWIRKPRVLVRGERGEISDFNISYLKDYKTPVHLELLRHNAGEDGNLEGYYNKGITLGDEWKYTNPFIPGRLSDDEIAIATCLVKMWEYVNGGPEVYSLAEASQDHYMGMMIQKAVETGETVNTEYMPWRK